MESFEETIVQTHAEADNIINKESNIYNDKESKRFYEELYSKADVLYFQVGVDCRVISANITAMEKLGFEEEAITGKNFLSFFESEQSEFVKKMIKTCFVRGYIKNFKTTMVGDSGGRIWVHVNGLTELDEGGRPKYARFLIQDNSESERRQNQLNQALRITNIMTHHGFSEVIAKDILTEIRDWLSCDNVGVLVDEAGESRKRIAIWEDTTTFDEMDADDIRGWSFAVWKQFIRMSEGSPACKIRQSGILYTESLPDLLLGIPSSQDKDRIIALAAYESLLIIPINEGGKAIGCLVAVQRERAAWSEEAIVHMERIVPMFSNLVHVEEETDEKRPQKDETTLLNIPILGIVLVREGMIQYANDWVEEFLGLSREEIHDQPLQNFVANEYQDVVNALIAASSPDIDSQEQRELIVITGDGRRRWVDCGCVVLPMNGRLTEVLYWTDKEDRKRLKSQLLEARKMESLGLLAGGIVHEFNNLLASVLGYSSLLSEEIDEDNPYYQDIMQILRTSEKATELTSRLMAYAQGGSYFVDEMDVNQLIKEVAGILSRTLDKNISIRADLDENLQKIKADASQIQQAIFQIALNARDAMPNGGKLIFQTKNMVLAEGDARLRYGGKPGGYIQIVISDTGQGMSGKVKECIFQPYFTTKSRTAGKGLGLAMVQEIVENHGGFISVFSEKSKGTIFKLQLPATGSKMREMQTPFAEKPPLGKETILLIDNEEVLRETARKMLTRYGYKVIIAATGTEGIAIYKKYINRIDLIMLDRIQSGIGVNKIVTWFKKLNPHAKIIITSDVGERGELGMDFRGHIAGIIEKPFQVRPLLRQVRSVLNA